MSNHYGRGGAVINILHRRDRLIITTIAIIEELGILGLSTKEIAKREGVSEATLFRHYKTKNELLLAVIDYYAKFDNDILESTRLKKLSPKEAIYYLTATSMGYYENYPAITSIMQIMDVLRYEPDFTDKIKEIVKKKTGNFHQLIQEAQVEGEIRQEINSENLAVAISGLCREMCLKWRFEGRNFPLKEETTKSIKMILDSLS